MRISKIMDSALLPSVATGAITGATILGYTVADLGSKAYLLASSMYAAGLLSSMSRIDLSNASELITRIPISAFVGMAAVGGTMGAAVALSHELGKKLLSRKEENQKNDQKSIFSTAIIPACITGGLGASTVGLIQNTAVTQGLNMVFQRPLFGVLPYQGPDVVRSIASLAEYFPTWVQDWAESTIQPLGTVSTQDVLLATASGLLLGTAVALTYQVAKKILREDYSSLDSSESKNKFTPISA